ncbi:MAG: hypothetical protein QNK03_27175 [Myxococcota bacterium]|nr:hypothetical protein [Myxococcota bacterium]
MLRTSLALGLALACWQASEALPATLDATHTLQISLGDGSQRQVDSRNQPQPNVFGVAVDHAADGLISFRLEGRSATEAAPVPLAETSVVIDGSACVSCDPKVSLAALADLRAELTYFVDVLAPAVQQELVFVPVLATCYLTAELDWDELLPSSSTDSHASVTHSFDVNGNGAGNFTFAEFAQVRTASLLPTSVSDLVDHTIMVPVPAGGFGTLRTKVTARVLTAVSMNNWPGSPSAASWQASALADPYIRVDPSWELADQYELVFSSGIENVPVPEPSVAPLYASAVLTLVLLERATSARRLRSRASRSRASDSSAKAPSSVGEGSGTRFALYASSK